MDTSTRAVAFELKATFRRLALQACVLLATGCGAGVETGGAEGTDQAEAVGQHEEAITGGWVTPTLINGWQNYNSNDAPAVGVVNGTVRFRGALSGSNASSTCAFLLPAAFRSYFTSGGVQSAGADQLRMRAVLANAVGGSIFYEPDLFAGQSPTKNCIHVVQDGVASGVGSAAMVFASLDGITFDLTTDNSTTLNIASGWGSIYTYRQHGQAGAYVKLVDGFVRFQGAIAESTGATTFLFNLPAQYRPGQAVYVPVNLCTGANQKYGRLDIYTNGDVYVQGDFAAARCLISLEGASYSLTTGGTTLSLLNGWVPYSPRAVKARVTDNGVVKLEGAVMSGTNSVITRLPTGMRPAHTVYLASDSWGAAQGRIYVTTDGYVTVQYPALSTAAGFTSLDGLSFSF